jgi:hypothetical protein
MYSRYGFDGREWNPAYALPVLAAWLPKLFAGTDTPLDGGTSE